MQDMNFHSFQKMCIRDRFVIVKKKTLTLYRQLTCLPVCLELLLQMITVQLLSLIHIYCNLFWQKHLGYSDEEAMAMYYNTAGEREARDVSARRDYRSEEHTSELQ